MKLFHKKEHIPNMLHPKEPTGYKNLVTTLPNKQIHSHPGEKNQNNNQAPLSGAKKNLRITIGIVYVLLVIMGISTGYLLAISTNPRQTIRQNTDQTNEIYTGPVDTSQFTDSASGVLEKGGIDGEGTHKLIREGGPSQTAYLTSSVIDLSQFIGKKVKVWGQTMAGEKASWFMDVGKIEEIQ